MHGQPKGTANRLALLHATAPVLDPTYEGGGVRFPAATRLIPMGERHLRKVVDEFVDNDHAERDHQGLGNVIPFPSAISHDLRGPGRRHERLGGLLNFYHRTAA